MSGWPGGLSAGTGRAGVPAGVRTFPACQSA